MSQSTQNPTRGHKKKARTRRQLLDAAMAVAAKRGEAFTISEVAEHAGVSNGTFYNYFADREVLVSALAVDIAERFTAAGAEAYADDEPVVRFATLSMLALVQARTAPEVFGAMSRLDVLRDASLDKGPLRFLVEDLRSGAEAGRLSLASVDAAVDLVVGSLLMASRRIAETGDDPKHRRAVISHVLMALGLPGAEAAAITEIADQRVGRV